MNYRKSDSNHEENAKIPLVRSQRSSDAECVRENRRGNVG